MYIFTMQTIKIGIIVLLAQNFVEGKKMGWENKFEKEFIFGYYKQAAVTSSGSQCSSVGMEMLIMNGSAVDAAIATLLCEGVSSLESNGLGGGFLMTIWDPSNGGTATFLDARETAPAAATEDMFHGSAALSQFGGKAVAVPGALKGYWEAHKKYGKLPWSTLFEPSIKLCKKGMVLKNKILARFLASKKSTIRAEPTIAEFLINPKTNSTWKVNDIIKRPKLAKTLKLLSKEKGMRSFYGGKIGKKLIKEIKAFGGIMTIDDLNAYTPLWRTPITSQIGEYTMYTAPPPGSGVLLSFIMNFLSDVVPIKEDKISWQRIVETFELADARIKGLGDLAYVDINELIAHASMTYANDIQQTIYSFLRSDDSEYHVVSSELNGNHRSAHICVLAPDGSAVSVTSSVNRGLEAMKGSKSSGIIFNDQMYNFGAPNVRNGYKSPLVNFIAPGKRPQSSMAPTIVVDENKRVRLVIGAAGRERTTKAIATQMILTLSEMDISFDPMFNYENFWSYLNEVGHNTMAYESWITQSNGNITANVGYQEYGSTSGF